MCMHILFCVCIWLFGWGGSFSHPTQQRKKAMEVYALRFVRTASYATVSYGSLLYDDLMTKLKWTKFKIVSRGTGY